MQTIPGGHCEKVVQWSEVSWIHLFPWDLGTVKEGCSMLEKKREKEKEAIDWSTRLELNEKKVSSQRKLVLKHQSVSGKKEGFWSTLLARKGLRRAKRSRAKLGGASLSRGGKDDPSTRGEIRLKKGVLMPGVGSGVIRVDLLRGRGRLPAGKGVFQEEEEKRAAGRSKKKGPKQLGAKTWN